MKKSKIRIAFHNLGCKVNAYELDRIREQFRDAFYEEVAFSEEADVYIINTCTVTNIADRKSRQMLHRAKRRNPKALVVAVGCYVNTDRETLQKDAAVDILLSNEEKGRCRQSIEGALFGAEKEPAENGQAPVSPLSGRMRADVKIEDGCNQFCAYCIIPYARGRVRSREEAEILAEVAELSKTGIPEVVLSGIHISSYGRDRNENPGEALLLLLHKINQIEAIRRIRLSSLEPQIITEPFVKGLSDIPKLCPHFHLSLQSGCDATLARMRRQYTTAAYRESVAMLRNTFSEPAITTDVIVGFPGETEEEFTETERFLREMAFYEMHVFPFSVRKGTAAAAMPDKVSDRVKTERSRKLLQLTAEQARRYREKFLGTKEELLIEENVVVQGRAYRAGYTARYVRGLLPLAPEKPEEEPCNLVRGRFLKPVPGTDSLLMGREEA